MIAFLIRDFRPDMLLSIKLISMCKAKRASVPMTFAQRTQISRPSRQLQSSSVSMRSFRTQVHLSRKL